MDNTIINQKTESLNNTRNNLNLIFKNDADNYYNFFKKEINKNNFIVFDNFNFVRNKDSEYVYFKKSLQYVDPSPFLELLFNFDDTINYENIFNEFCKSSKKISIVMTHKNRPELLFLTLLSISKSQSHNFEVIVIDDNSDKDKLPLFLNFYKFPFLIKYIVMDDSFSLPNRNPGKAYNVGFDNADGDIIMIQNSECMHMGDLLTYVNKNFNYDDYLSFPCYASNNKNVNNILMKNSVFYTIGNIEENTKNINREESMDNFPMWFQHPIENNRNLHFCTVISNNYIKMINFFDETYFDGINYEDDDLLFRIKKIGLNVIPITLNENIGVVHLFHGNRANPLTNPSIPSNILWDSVKTKHELNGKIFEQRKNNNKPFCVPKIFHYYWDDLTKFTYYNYISLLSAIHYHKDWVHIVWMPQIINKNITWLEIFNKDQIYNNNYVSYIQHLKSFNNVRFFIFNECVTFNLPSDMSEIHKKDILGYMIIYLFGGIWSDLDIVYIKNINDLVTDTFDNIICKFNFLKSTIFPVGFFCSKKRTKYFKSIIDKIFDFYDKNRYQCLGSEMLSSRFNGVELTKLYGEKNKIVDDSFYMPYLWLDEDINVLFKDFDKENTKNLSQTLGIHWFNGSNITKKYIEIYEKNNQHCYGLLNHLTANIKHKNKFKFIYHDYLPENYKFYNYVKNYYFKIISNNFESVSISITKVFNNKYHPFIDNDFNKYFPDRDDDKTYVFGELDYVYLIFNYLYVDQVNAMNIINKINYFVYFSEIFIDESLTYFGLPEPGNDFTKSFFRNAKKILIQDTKNKIFLMKNDISNDKIIYHPIYGYSPINSIVPLPDTTKEIDVLIYGNFPVNKDIGEDIFPYRATMTNKVKLFCETTGYKFMMSECLHGEDKDNILKKTKIVIHIPSHQVRTLPWAKITELMAKKVFFIVEESDEIYCRNLQNQIVFYKKNDTNNKDLFTKIFKYIDNDADRHEYIEKNFNYIKNNYNMDTNIISIINTL